MKIKKKYIKKINDIKGVPDLGTPINLQLHTKMINNFGLFSILQISA